MPRTSRIVVPGAPHHITQRGIRRTDVFIERVDYKAYLTLFRENALKFGLYVRAYCLMSNHVHFVAIPERDDSIWKTFHRCHTIYAKYFNEKYATVGHLWQGRPDSCALDEAHFWTATRYVELNPVRAKMVCTAPDYPWSSAAAHCGFRSDPLINDDWQSREARFDWQKWLTQDEFEERIVALRKHTKVGRPYGNDSFIRSVEQKTGRALRPKRRGRKPRN